MAVVCCLLFVAIASPQSSDDVATHVLEATAKVTRKIDSIRSDTGTAAITRFVRHSVSDKKWLWLVSNEHVTGAQGNAVSCEFQWAGWTSPKFSGKVLKADKGRDISVILVNLNQNPLLAHLPMLPVAKEQPDYARALLGNAGCAGGHTQRFHRVTFLELNSGHCYYIPAGRSGDSGGAVVDMKRREWVGLQFGATDAGSKGLFQSLDLVGGFASGKDMSLRKTSNSVTSRCLPPVQWVGHVDSYDEKDRRNPWNNYALIKPGAELPAPKESAKPEVELKEMTPEEVKKAIADALKSIDG